MCRVTVNIGSKHGINIKSADFQTKENAVVFITMQLNKILNDSNVKQWDISMQEFDNLKKL